MLWPIVAVMLSTAAVLAVILWQGARVRKTFDKVLREEHRTDRDELGKSLRGVREEVINSLAKGNVQLSSAAAASANVQRVELENLSRRLADLTDSIVSSLREGRDALQARLDVQQEMVDKKLEEVRRGTDVGLRNGFESGQKMMLSTLAELGQLQQTRLDAASDRVDRTLAEIRKAVDETLGLRVEAATKAISVRLTDINQRQQEGLKSVGDEVEKMSAANRNELTLMREQLDRRVAELQQANDKKLEEMRRTVDEKLHDTLERRLGESFRTVSDRLEAVQRGIGEMQTLASGVGDLKRVLTNVKARGTWAEVQLGAILEQMLAPGQYRRNVHTREDAAESVEYAVGLPGPDGTGCIWLPIDSKFPQEDYARLQAAADRGDSEGVQRAVEDLTRAVHKAGRDICAKYLDPPRTTDFAIMYLATEGLYAEVVRQPALVERLQRECRVVPAGPTTLAAILSSLRMGFQTLAVEQRAGEVRRVLAAVKAEFEQFGSVLAKVKKQLSTASSTIDQTQVRTRAMARKLRAVDTLPAHEAATMLGLPETTHGPRGTDSLVEPQLLEKDAS